MTVKITLIKFSMTICLKLFTVIVHVLKYINNSVYFSKNALKYLRKSKLTYNL